MDLGNKPKEQQAQGVSNQVNRNGPTNEGANQGVSP